MTFKGRIENGRVVLENTVLLPEGTSVLVELIPIRSTDDLHPDIQKFTGIVPQNVDAQTEHRAANQAKHG